MAFQRPRSPDVCGEGLGFAALSVGVAPVVGVEGDPDAARRVRADPQAPLHGGHAVRHVDPVAQVVAAVVQRARVAVWRGGSIVVSITVCSSKQQPPSSWYTLVS